MFGCVLSVAGGLQVVVDRIEEDRVVIEWCDTSTSDLPASIFPVDLHEGAVVTLYFRLASPADAPLPGPNLDGTDLHAAGRPVPAAPDPRGSSRTEIYP